MSGKAYQNQQQYFFFYLVNNTECIEICNLCEISADLPTLLWLPPQLHLMLILNIHFVKLCHLHQTRVHSTLSSVSQTKDAFPFKVSVLFDLNKDL